MRAPWSYRRAAEHFAARPRSGRRLRLRLLLPVVLVTAALALAGEIRRLESYAASPFPVARAVPYHPERVIPGTPGTDLGTEPVLPIALRPGETVGELLEGLGLGPAEMAEVIDELGRHADLRRLRSADTVRTELDEDRRLRALTLTLAGRGRARVVREDGAWRGGFREFVRSVDTAGVRGRLEDSLEGAILGAGGETMLAYRMSEVLQWDLDFNRDLRQGDLFEVLYERVFLDGNFDSLGAVLAVRYSNRGKTLEAYRFGDPPGYYDGEGRPMRKMFLRSPLRFSRITSRFSGRRFHPVLNVYRPHYGVDYGAPRGTPVRVTANGVVASAGWEKGGGRTVKVRHPNGYLTAYLHLSRFAGGVRPGRRVAQGEVIGYVGSTGLATAPHLDYRVQHRGRWINPLSLKSVPTAPMPDDRLPEFLAWRDALRDGLSRGGPFEPHLAAPAPERVARAGAPGASSVAPGR